MKIFLFILILLFPAVIFASEDDTDSKLLEESVALSKEVKEFGRTLGIEPGLALTFSSAEKKPQAYLWIWIAKKEKIDINEKIITVQVGFTEAKENVPLAAVGAWNNDYSIYYRIGNEFATKDSAITASFAREVLPRKVMVIIHEDLHANFSHAHPAEESLVTPLGYLAALQYFERKGDNDSATYLLKELEYFKKVSGELNDLLFASHILYEDFPDKEARLESKKLLQSYKTYGVFHSFGINSQNADSAFEAKIAIDFAYWGFFNQIIKLYGLMSDLKILIEDLKQAPVKMTDIEKYLKDLELKYANPAL